MYVGGSMLTTMVFDEGVAGLCGHVGCGYTDLELIYLLIENLKPLY